MRRRHRKALWQGEDKMLRQLKNSVKTLERLGPDHPKARGLITEINDVLFYYPKWKKYVPEHLLGVGLAASDKIARQLVRLAKELVAGRPKDVTGKPIYVRGEYLLRDKRAGRKYYGGGSLHAPRMVGDTDDAIVVTGATLLDMGYDWTMNWEAVPDEDDFMTASDKELVGGHYGDYIDELTAKRMLGEAARAVKRLKRPLINSDGDEYEVVFDPRREAIVFRGFEDGREFTSGTIPIVVRRGEYEIAPNDNWESELRELLR